MKHDTASTGDARNATEGVPYSLLDVSTADSTDRGHAEFVFEETRDASVAMTLGKRSRTFNTLAYLTPHSSVFKDSVTVRVDNLHHDPVTLRYTTDGTEPTTASPVCGDELTLTATTKLTIRAFADDGTVFTPMTATYTKAVLQPADVPGNLRPGVGYEYFEGDWRKLPDFDSLSAVASGVAETIDLSHARREEQFAMRFSGYLEVPADDVYTFTVRSDDGCRLLIDGQTVVDLDGLCGRDAREKSGQIGLAAGKHAIEVLHFQQGLRKTLRVSWGTESTEMRPITARSLSTK